MTKFKTGDFVRMTKEADEKRLWVVLKPAYECGLVRVKVIHKDKRREVIHTWMPQYLYKTNK